MIDAAQTLSAPSAASLIGIAGLAVRVASPLLSRRETILTAQLAATCLFATSYTLMDHRTAASVCLIGAAQAAVALIAGNRPWLGKMGYVFMPVVLAMGVATFSGLPTILAVTACCLTMVGRLQTDLMRMRGIQLCANPFGAAHDVVVGAWPCLAGAVLSFTVAAIAFRREWRRRAPA
ncbi:YgjV family protein [Defluviimonas sp. D31]|uniref:YgjV family protein n=1 Tax=Defluviimonas sp. D31 TaxID=3083253 RepID=UPI00296F288A|nr:YgjV family protein [Defluviimonas sp. D31]MDW4551459.1 YgjV family protein [Defluviimonas sp. D31]